MYIFSIARLAYMAVLSHLLSLLALDSQSKYSVSTAWPVFFLVTTMTGGYCITSVLGA
jgi:hypothetical protein